MDFIRFRSILFIVLTFLAGYSYPVGDIGLEDPHQQDYSLVCLPALSNDLTQVVLS